MTRDEMIEKMARAITLTEGINPTRVDERWQEYAIDPPKLLAFARACIALGQEDMLDRACKAAKREA